MYWITSTANGEDWPEAAAARANEMNNAPAARVSEYRSDTGRLPALCAGRRKPASQRHDGMERARAVAVSPRPSNGRAPRARGIVRPGTRGRPNTDSRTARPPRLEAAAAWRQPTRFRPAGRSSDLGPDRIAPMRLPRLPTVNHGSGWASRSFREPVRRRCQPLTAARPCRISTDFPVAPGEPERRRAAAA